MAETPAPTDIETYRNTYAEYMLDPAYSGRLGQSPHVKFFDERNGGYMRCVLTHEDWRTEMKLADSIKDPDSPVRTFVSFVVEDGQPGAKRAREDADEPPEVGPGRARGVRGSPRAGCYASRSSRYSRTEHAGSE